MFGVKVHPHRSLVIITGILLCFIIIFLSKSKKYSNEIVRDNNNNNDDDDINLVDLFDSAFPLVYEAGETIKLFKNTKENYGKLFNKPSKNEPVTIADLLSHSIIINGLKDKFPNLKIVSEEKDSFNQKEFNEIKKHYQVEHKYPKFPFVFNDKHLLTFPLSSIGVWVDPLDATKEFTG